MEALGHGSTGYLIAQAQQQQQTISACSVLSAAAMASAAGALTKGSCHYLGQGSVVEDACKCLLKAPLLSELHEWSSWQLLFEAKLGSLSDFLEHKGMSHPFAMLCCAVLCLAAPCCAMLRHAAPCCAMLRHAAPCCAMLCHDIPRCCFIQPSMSIIKSSVWPSTLPSDTATAVCSQCNALQGNSQPV